MRFFFFHFFKILILRVAREVKEQRMPPQLSKKFVRRIPYLRYHTSYDCHLW